MVTFFPKSLRISSCLLTTEGQIEEKVFQILLIVRGVLSLVTSYEVGNTANVSPKFKYDNFTLFYSLTLGTAIQFLAVEYFPSPSFLLLCCFTPDKAMMIPIATCKKIPNDKTTRNENYSVFSA
jgi:hypothetical protein